jgi:hypothetical protein
MTSFWDISSKWKWIVLALFVKSLLFLYFAVEFNENWPAKDIQSSIVVFYQDSYTYYVPVEEWADGKGYYGACRMPGFLPIYAPLYMIFGAPPARVMIILLQVLLDAITTYLLALFAYRIKPQRHIFLLVFFISAISSFVSVWNNYAVSDSFAVSTLILVFFFLQKFGEKQHLRDLIIAGLFLAWSIFFRPIHLLALPVFAIFLMRITLPFWKNLFGLMRNGVILILPLTICIALWTWRNQVVYQKFIPLQDDPGVCYYNLQEYHIALRDNILAWGMDFQEWSLNTEFAWFLDANDQRPCPLPNRVFTTRFNADSLQVLKNNYQSALTAERNGLPTFEALRTEVIRQSDVFKDSYVNEKPMEYYGINRLRLLRLFLFSGRVDNLPLPARSEMSLFQFAFKSFYLLLLSGVIVCGLVGCCISLGRSFQSNRFLLVYPILHIVALGAVLGYAEQRYLTPAYPFLIVGAALWLGPMVEWCGKRFFKSVAL